MSVVKSFHLSSPQLNLEKSIFMCTWEDFFITHTNVHICNRCQLRLNELAATTLSHTCETTTHTVTHLASYIAYAVLCKHPYL